MNDEPVRFADILTTASAVANYLAVTEVTPAHLLDAVALLRGEKQMEDLGKALSPLVRRGGGHGGVTAPVRDLVQRWFAAVGSDPNAELSGESLARFLADVHALT
jgi:hypothetical protein